MRRPTLVVSGLLGLVLAVLPHSASARGDFDSATGAISLKRDAIRTIDFESPEALVGLQRAAWYMTEDGYPDLQLTPITKAAEIAAQLTEGSEDVIEGSHGIRLGPDFGGGLLLADAATFAAVKDSKFEVSLWARSDGTSAQVTVSYDADPANTSAFAQFASVRAVRTGRETSDGWAEYSTGPLDGNVWGVPVRAIAIVPSAYAEPGQSFVVDALEIRKVEGKLVAPVACTMQTVDAVCGADADCMYGHCVPSSVTWGVLPAAAHRREIAERWVQFSTRLIGDRNAAKLGTNLLAPTARILAKDAASSRQFFGGLNRLVNLLRDNHTGFGAPANYSAFAPQVQSSSSSVLGACFGVVEKDIAGGGLGYAVFRAGDTPASGVALQRGDLLFAIDGRDPKEWVDEVYPQVATALPNDPDSDWGVTANDLSRLIGMRANNVTVVRCASASSCSGANRTTLTIDVASAAFRVLTSPADPNAPRSFSCTQRFSNSVTPPTGGGGGGGEDRVNIGTGPNGETRAQFDGFVGQNRWQSSMSSIFTPQPAKVLMDARMGHGGYYSTVEYLFNLLRGTSEPMGVISLGRGTYELTDPPWLLSRLGTCAGGRDDGWSCFQANANGFFATKAAPPGAGSKIAWLNTYDVSANDFMPKLLKGRSNVKIFAPHPTSGAFGAVISLPSLWTGWSGGSIQIQDTRFGANLAAATAARWESGHGVEPDIVVTEKLSDAISGVDTILDTATAWLASP